MLESAAQVCLNVSQCIICINESNISITQVCPNETLDRTLGGGGGGFGGQGEGPKMGGLFEKGGMHTLCELCYVFGNSLIKTSFKASVIVSN